MLPRSLSSASKVGHMKQGAEERHLHLQHLVSQAAAPLSFKLTGKPPLACPLLSLTALGKMVHIDNIVEDFDSPEQLQPLLLQYPMYDVAITETLSTGGIGGIASGQGVDNVFKPPPWIDTLRQTGRQTVDDAVVEVRGSPADTGLRLGDAVLALPQCHCIPLQLS